MRSVDRDEPLKSIVCIDREEEVRPKILETADEKCLFHVSLKFIEGQLEDVWSGRCDYCDASGFECGEKESEYGHMRSRKDHYRISDTPERLIAPIPLVLNLDKRKNRVSSFPTEVIYFEENGIEVTRVYDPRYLKSFADWLSEAKASASEQHNIDEDVDWDLIGFPTNQIQNPSTIGGQHRR